MGATSTRVYESTCLTSIEILGDCTRDCDFVVERVWFGLCYQRAQRTLITRNHRLQHLIWEKICQPSHGKAFRGVMQFWLFEIVTGLEVSSIKFLDSVLIANRNHHILKISSLV